MTLGTFKSRIRDTLNRGTTLDAELDEAVRDAIQKTEQNSNLHYMHRWVSFTISKSGTTPRLLTPPTRVKSMEFLRLVIPSVPANGSDLEYLTKVNSMDVDKVPKEKPSMFWLDGVDHIVLNSDPDEDYSAEIGYWQHTDVAAMVDTDNHWLIDNARQLLLQETLLLMVPYSKEDNVTFQQRIVLRDEAEMRLLLAEDAFEQGPAGQTSMAINIE